MDNETKNPQGRPRVGVPWRTAAEQEKNKRRNYRYYLEAVEEAGGEPVEISLSLAPAELAKIADTLDAIVLPGSPADVDPARYGSARHRLTAEPDLKRERTDDCLLDHAFSTGKPVLAICYGAQLLNVHLGGNLFQDIPSELHTETVHDHEDDEPDALHPIQIAATERNHIAELVGLGDVREPEQKEQSSVGSRTAIVNSSHHQSIREPGEGLHITARAPDGVVEAVEWTGNSEPKRAWIVGVQWHPERMRGDALASALFRKLVTAAREKKT